MGLTVYYDLDLPGDQPERRALELVEALRETALRLGAERASGVRRILRADCESLADQELDLDWLVRCFAQRGVDDPREPGRLVAVLPDLAYGFGAVIGRCEPVLLGLARHPATVIDGEIEVCTGLGDWSWRACTKTQYASLVSLEHFLESHRRVIALLDAAAALGVTVAARDDSGYWEHRDEQKLVEAVERWNALIARIAGGLADGCDQGGTTETGLMVCAPIFRHREFERLEAQA